MFFIHKKPQVHQLEVQQGIISAQLTQIIKYLPYLNNRYLTFINPYI